MPGRNLARARYLQVPVDQLIKEEFQLGNTDSASGLLTLKFRGVEYVELFIGDKVNGNDHS